MRTELRAALAVVGRRIAGSRFGLYVFAIGPFYVINMKKRGTIVGSRKDDIRAIRQLASIPARVILLSLRDGGAFGRQPPGAKGTRLTL
jgi:hypothetical protein